MALRTDPDTYILESRILERIPRIRRFFDRILIGSTGAEVWSGVTFIVLGTIILSPPPGTRGFLLNILGRVLPYVALAIMVLVGGVHLVALSSRLSKKSIAVRKICSALEVTAWTAIVWNMVKLYQYGSAISLGVLVLMLYISVARRKYVI